MAEFPIIAPGRWGLNTIDAERAVHPNWATKAKNCVLNDARQLTGRSAIDKVSIFSSADGALLRAFVGRAFTSEFVITSQADALWSMGSDGTATERTGSLTPSAGYWQFADFRGEIFGWQDGETPIKFTGIGNFANHSASSGTLPDGDNVLAAFGRLWATDDDQQTIKYSALADPDAWDTASGAGSIDLRNVWTNGLDYITGIAAFGSNLVVFGRRHVIFYTDGQGSATGISPDQMYVVDTVEGVGCVARDTIIEVGGDLIFVSERGVESMRRLLVQKDHPLVTLSWQIQDTLRPQILAFSQGLSYGESARELAAMAVPDKNWYVLFVDNGGSDNVIYVFHVGDRQVDDEGREFVPITTWENSDGDPNDRISNMCHGVVTVGTSRFYMVGDEHLWAYDEDDYTDSSSTSHIYVEMETGWLRPPDEIAHLTVQLKSVEYRLYNPDGQTLVPVASYGTDYADTLDTLTGDSTSATRVQAVFDPTGDVEGQLFKFGVTFDETSSATGGGGVQWSRLTVLFKVGKAALGR